MENVFSMKRVKATPKTKRTRRRFTDQEKRDLLAKVREGLTLKQISRETGVQLQNLIRWRREGYGRKVVLNEVDQLTALKKENEVLKGLLLKTWTGNRAA